MRYIIKSKQLYSIVLVSIVIGFFLGNSAKNNFLESYIGNMGNISIRYFLIIISIAIEYIVYKTLNNSCIISRYKNKQNITCELCEHCMYVEHGDMYCEEHEDFADVYDEFCPTENYMWCNGKKFIER